jgi:hypothetical protein
MRKMFSGSGSARKAARKSAAVRRKNVHREVALHPAAMQDEIDYVARWAFLHATTSEMKPAPIDELLDLLPTFSRWVAHFEIDENPIVAAMRKFAAANNCRISPQDDSVEAAAVKNALSAWMKERRFGDEWIEEAALCTLFCHAEGIAAHRNWYLMPPYQQMNPELNFTLPRKGNESDEQYLKRFDEECRKRRKEFVKLVQFRKGARKGQLLPAKWTTLVFVGKTFAEIARSEKQQEDTVRKAIGAFSRRAKLQLPKRRPSLALRVTGHSSSPGS